jgi:hypothetical protein
MRQQEDDSVLTLATQSQQDTLARTGTHLPLLLSRRDELVDNDLGAVAKISKLRFPEHKRHRRLHSETVSANESTSRWNNAALI